MSYILDALRRADAERDRERGAVPGLHAQAAMPELADDAAPQRSALPWVAGLGGAVLVGVVAWWFWPGAAPSAPSAPPPMPPMTQAAAPPPTPMPQAPPAAAAEPRPPFPLPAVPSEPVPPPVARVAAPAAAPAASVPSSPPTAAVSGPASATTPTVPLLADLPAALRQQLPPLVVGGSMYSENAAQRMVILDGQLLREGDKLGPELKLEQVRAKGAILRFREQRFELRF